MKLVRILILEDDLQTLSKLLEKFSELETKLINEKETELSVVVLSEYKQVERYINSDPRPEFDIVLLDRDCKIGGSFHILDINKFGVNKIIGMSSVPDYNFKLRNLGVLNIVNKDYDSLNIFTNKISKMVINIVNSQNF